MTAPVPHCPIDYNCTFQYVHPRVITVTHTLGGWWKGVGGFVVGGIAVILLAAFLITATVMFFHYRKDRLEDQRAERERIAERRQQLALEEQHTMQFDAAKGDPDTLKQLREIVR
jgi:hypothetical protein